MIELIILCVKVIIAFYIALFLIVVVISHFWAVVKLTIFLALCITIFILHEGSVLSTAASFGAFIIINFIAALGSYVFED